MPYQSHRIKGSNHRADEQQVAHVQRPADHAAAPAEAAPDLMLQRAGHPSGAHVSALARVDAGARGRLVTSLQRTLGNAHVQRLIAGINGTSTHIHRCGGKPCNCGSEDDGIHRVQRLGQPAAEEQLPRGASIAGVSTPPRREEEESRPPAR